MQKPSFHTNPLKQFRRVLFFLVSHSLSAIGPPKIPPSRHSIPHGRKDTQVEPDLDYQMPSYTTLMVNDLDLATRWYCDTLGFALISQMPGANGAPIVSHLRWAPHADVILMAEGPNALIATIKGAGVTLNFTALRESVDAIAKRVRRAGNVQISGPHNRPWNAREVIVIDPNGYRLNFTEPLHASIDGDDLMAQVAEQLEEITMN